MLAKLCFNFLLVLAVNSVLLAAFLVLLRITVAAPGLLLITVVLGTLGLAGTTTLLAAIVARSRPARAAFAHAHVPAFTARSAFGH